MSMHHIVISHVVFAAAIVLCIWVIATSRPTHL